MIDRASTNLCRRDFLGLLMGTAALPAVTLYAPAASADADLERKLAADPRRPQFHLLPPANWQNDPNAPIYWNGNYHMFYQYNPHGAYWGDMHWGHAVSRDMVHWKHLPVALAPTPGGPDADGCFTGTAIVQDGKVLLMYTGVHAAAPDRATIKDGAHSLVEKQCLALANDPDLIAWTKVDKPVIAAPPAGMDVNGFRDPSPWRQGRFWYTVLGSGIAHRGGAVLLYRSADLRAWEFLHVLAQRSRQEAGSVDPVDPWEVWECPEFFALGDWHVLIYGTLGKCYWQTGKLDTATMTFTPVRAGLADYGSYYAAKTQLDAAGNRILWGWVQEARPVEEHRAAGWACMTSLPRVLSVSGNGELSMRFADALIPLRTGERSLDIQAAEDEKRRQIDSIRIRNCCGELRIAAQRSGEPFQLTILGASDRTPWIAVSYDPARPDRISIEGHPISIRASTGEPFDLHLYIDSSVIELLVNGQAAWTKRFYFPDTEPVDAAVRWNGSTAPIEKLTVWQLTPISAHRLTR